MKTGYLFIPENEDDRIKVHAFWTGYNNNQTANQSTLTNNKNNTCSKCGKTVDQKVINYCKIQYDGAIFCRACQEGGK